MRKLIWKLETILATAVFAGAILSCPLVASASAVPAGAQAQSGNNEAAAVQSRLNKKQYQNVHVTMKDGIATLSGTVDLYEYKADALKTVLHTKGVSAVRNQIEVTGNVPDAELQKKLSEKLAYDRIGFGHVFDAISLNVSDGVATLGGHVHDYFNRDSALGLVATTHGVKDVIDNIEVDPVSPMDDQTRIAVARAVYGFTTLNKYAMDPRNRSAFQCRTAKWSSTEWLTQSPTKTPPSFGRTAFPVSLA